MHAHGAACRMQQAVFASAGWGAFALTAVAAALAFYLLRFLSRWGDARHSAREQVQPQAAPQAAAQRGDTEPSPAVQERRTRDDRSIEPTQSDRQHAREVCMSKSVTLAAHCMVVALMWRMRMARSEHRAWCRGLLRDLPCPQPS